MKRVVVISDLHCGHQVGLTPPSWQCNKQNPEYKKFQIMQEELWKFYMDTIKALKPIDVLVVNGDAIDGKGERSGGTELNEPDITTQCAMAEHAIKQAEAKNVIMTYGTPYHTGVTADFENVIARSVGATIGGHEWISVNGVIFDVKHFIGGTVVPYGRLTSLERDRVWNELWSMDESQPRANIIIRSHVHGFNYSGDKNTLSIKTPALQGFGSKYGIRKCSGMVDIGIIHFDIEDNGEYIWGQHLLEGDFLKVQPLQL